MTLMEASPASGDDDQWNLGEKLVAEKINSFGLSSLHHGRTHLILKNGRLI